MVPRIYLENVDPVFHQSCQILVKQFECADPQRDQRARLEQFEGGDDPKPPAMYFLSRHAMHYPRLEGIVRSRIAIRRERFHRTPASGRDAGAGLRPRVSPERGSLQL